MIFLKVLHLMVKVKWTTEKKSDKFGIVEIKCPFEKRKYIPLDAVGNADFWTMTITIRFKDK